jgi:hypothetical protein
MPPGVPPWAVSSIGWSSDSRCRSALLLCCSYRLLSRRLDLIFPGGSDRDHGPTSSSRTFRASQGSDEEPPKAAHRSYPLRTSYHPGVGPSRHAHLLYVRELREIADVPRTGHVPECGVLMCQREAQRILLYLRHLRFAAWRAKRQSHVSWRSIPPTPGARWTRRPKNQLDCRECLLAKVELAEASWA